MIEQNLMNHPRAHSLCTRSSRVSGHDLGHYWNSFNNCFQAIASARGLNLGDLLSAVPTKLLVKR